MIDPPEEAREQFERETNDQFAALGRYIQEFEQVCLSLRHTIIMMLQLNGLTKQELANIVISHNSVTAAPLLDIACAMMKELHGSEDDFICVMNQFRREFLEEIKIRNEWLHGSWHIGWASWDGERFSRGSLGFRHKISPKKGLSTGSLPDSIDELRARTLKLEEIGFGFRRILGCIVVSHSRPGGLKAKENFLLIGSRYVSPDLAKKRGWAVINFGCSLAT